MAATVSSTTAQHALLRKGISDDVFRIDPRGELPQYINDPLPFVHRPARQSVVEQQSSARYYYADETGNWSLDHLEVRQMNPLNGDVTSLLINEAYPSGYEKSVSAFDSLGRTTSTLSYVLSGSSWVPSRWYQWEYQGYLLKNEKFSVYENGDWIVIHSVDNEIELDNNGNPVSMISIGMENGTPSAVSRYDMEYINGKLHAITVSSVDGQKGTVHPYFRCDDLVATGNDWAFIHYVSKEFVDGEWITIREDELTTNNPVEWVFNGVLLKGGDPSRVIQNKVVFDEKKNMTGFIQCESEFGSTQWDTTGSIHFDVRYDESGQPSEVVSNYWLNGTTRASVKVVFGTAEGSREGSVLGLYPNPVSRHVSIYWSEQLRGKGLAEVVDTNGKTVLTTTIDDLSNGVYSLNIEPLTTGVYTVRLNCDSGDWTNRLVIVN